MDTTTLNTPASGGSTGKNNAENKDGKKTSMKTVGGYAATAAGAAAAGAGAAMAMGGRNAEPVVEPEAEDMVEEVQTDDVAVVDDTPRHDGVQPSVQPETHPGAHTESQTSVHSASPSASPAPGADEPVVTEVNPDEIAEAIIAGEQVDPNDIDMEDVINFDEIGTIYTVEGESYTAATFHDAYGNEMIMVDVDGDDTFDIIADADGNIVAEAPSLTVDDAELDIMGDGSSYLAHNDAEMTDEFGADTIADDLIS